ncbi:hypothetical protein [Streptomyces sp. NPDC007205]|uniref:hypothetical protein n=1 Tax=Streptomyces sp. NPDC007205 TaxID=3154316 RepID=UPI0033EC5788
MLPDEPRPLPRELADVERTVAYRGGVAGVRQRVEALRTASSSLTLFLERLPSTLHDWFGRRAAHGPGGRGLRLSPSPTSLRLWAPGSDWTAPSGSSSSGTGTTTARTPPTTW